MNRLSIDFCGVNFKNPVIPASGTFGYGREYEQFYPLSRLGGISVKGTTLNRREGNPGPRVAETPSGMLNSVGLQNGGVKKFLEYEMPNLVTKDTRIIANIAGATVEECAELAAMLEGSAVDLIELNISCPNVKAGGAAFGTDCTIAGQVTRAVKDATSKPLMVKLSPNVTSITDIAKSVEANGADAVSLINTLLGMRIDIKTGRPILKNNVGGLSGAFIPVSEDEGMIHAVETGSICLEKLEAIAKDFDGVDKVFAIQAGREIRVVVNPEKIDDLKAHKLARDVKEKIENELTYPGHIKVTVIREIRANEIAK